MEAGTAGKAQGNHPHVPCAADLLKTSWDSITPRTIARYCFKTSTSAVRSFDLHYQNSVLQFVFFHLKVQLMPSLTVRVAVQMTEIVSHRDNSGRPALNLSCTLLSPRPVHQVLREVQETAGRDGGCAHGRARETEANRLGGPCGRARAGACRKRAGGASRGDPH